MLIMFSLVGILALQTLLAVTNITVTSSEDDLSHPAPKGSLREAINKVNAGEDTEFYITFHPSVSTITLAGPLPPIHMKHPSDIVNIDGNLTTIDGNSLYRGFFVNQGDATISQLTFQNMLAKGGDGGGANFSSGGGGGLGAGSILFVGEKGTATVRSITFSGTQAVAGGNGGNGSIVGGGGGSGGGGLHGCGGTAIGNAAAGGGGYNGNAFSGQRGGTGGGGMFGHGSENATGSAQYYGGEGGGRFPGSNGKFLRTTPEENRSDILGCGGHGGVCLNHSSIEDNGSGENGHIFGGGGGAGGVAGTRLGSGGSGGSGGDYGGGGGGSIRNHREGAQGPGGSGGFGGGGGGGGGSATHLNSSGTGVGGLGGFGAGGGGAGGSGSINLGGASLAGGGSGGTSSSSTIFGSGGGGAALGGLIFVREGGTLIVDNDLQSGTLTAGRGGTSGFVGTDGETAGTAIYIHGNTTIHIGGKTGTRTISGTIEDDQSLTQGIGTFGSGSLNKLGANTVILTASNSYTGPTTVSEGTLLLSGAGDFPNSQSLKVMGVLDFSAADGDRSITNLEGNGKINLGAHTLCVKKEGATSFSGEITGSGHLRKSTKGTLTFSGINTYSGATIIEEGTLALDSAGSLSPVSVVDVTGTFDLSKADKERRIGGLKGSGNVVLGANNLAIEGDISTNFSGNISGTGGVKKSGIGILTLSGKNSYLGITTVSEGHLRLNGAGNLSHLTVLKVDGSFDLSSANQGQSVASLEGSGNIILGANHLSMESDASSEFSGEISGSGGISKSGKGTFTLSGRNAYSGATKICEGTLVLRKQGALTSDTAVEVMGVFDISAANQGQSVASLKGSGSVILGNHSLSIVGNEVGTFSGEISGNAGITKSGLGRLTFSGVNTYSGPTIVEEGHLALSTRGSISSSSIVKVMGVFDLSTANGDRKISKLEGSGNIELGKNTLSIVGSGSSYFSGEISGSGGVKKSGIGTLTLAGNNSYSGVTKIDQGILALNGKGVIGNSNAVHVSGTFDLSAASGDRSIGSLEGAGAVVLGENTLTTTVDDSSEYLGVISGSGGLIKKGKGVLFLSGVNTYSGVTTISEGSLSGNTTTLQGNSSRKIVNNANLIFDQAALGSFDGTITQTEKGTLIKENIGVLNFKGELTQDSLVVNDGTLNLSGNGSIKNAVIHAGSLILSNTGTLGHEAALDVSGTFDIGFAKDGQSIVSLKGAGRVFLGENFLSIEGDDSTEFSGEIVGSGGITKSGAGTLTLSGTNIYTGTTTIHEGSLSLRGQRAIGKSSKVNVLGTFDLSKVGGDLSIGGLEGTGKVFLAEHTLSFLSDESTEFSGEISGPGGIEKSGKGALTLSGLNAYSGSTTISAGTLSLNGAGALSSSSALKVGGVFDLSTADGDRTIGSLEGSGSINLGNNTLLTMTHSSTQFSGEISGNGGVKKVGIGTLVLSGTNTYKGITTIDEGTLSLKDAGTLSLSSPVKVSGVFDISKASGNRSIHSLDGSGKIFLGVNTLSSIADVSTTFRGAISGKGGIVKKGNGTLNLLGPNTYSGTTTVVAGTLSGNSISFQGDSSRKIVNHSNLVFDQKMNGLYNGTITGTGTFTKKNLGSLNITGTFDQKTLNITQGSLAVNAAGTVSKVQVSPGAILKGVGPLGSFGGQIFVAGTMAPGNSIGTTTIIGDFVQIEASTLEVELNPVISDQLQISGDYQIQPGVTLSIVPEFGSYLPGTEYSIAQTTGEIAGTFTALRTPFPSFEFEALYLTDEIRLRLDIVSFSNLSLEGNAAIASACLDTFTPANGSDLYTVIQQLQFMNAEQQQQTLDQMHPSLFSAIDLVSQETLLNVENIFGAAQAGTQADLDQNEILFWMDYYANQSTQQNQHGQKGYSNTTQAGVLGANWNFVSGNHFRMLLGYTNDDMKWKSSYGKNITDSFIGALKVELSRELFYTAISLLGAFQKFDVERNIDFHSFSRQAKHTNYGGSVLGCWEFGKQFKSEAASICPYEKLSYVYNHRKAFTESGANSINLSVDAHHADLLRSETGLKFLKQFDVSGSIYLTLAALWEGRFMGEETAQYTSIDCTMNVSGLSPNRWMGMASFGGSVNRGPFTFSVEGEGIWSKYYSSYLGRIEVGINF